MRINLRHLGLAIAIALLGAARPAAAGVMAQAVPVKYNLTCRPGEVVVRDVEIANQGEHPVVVHVTWSDWQMSEAGDLSLAAGSVALRDSTGQSVAGGTLPTGVILPGRTRTFRWICAASLAPGRYTATATLDTGGPELTLAEGSFAWPALRTRTLAVQQP